MWLEHQQPSWTMRRPRGGNLHTEDGGQQDRRHLGSREHHAVSTPALNPPDGRVSDSLGLMMSLPWADRQALLTSLCITQLRETRNLTRMRPSLAGSWHLEMKETCSAVPINVRRPSPSITAGRSNLSPDGKAPGGQPEDALEGRDGRLIQSLLAGLELTWLFL